MKKIVWPLAAIALLAAIGFKVATDPWLFKQLPTYSTVSRTNTVVSPADAAANGICRGTLTAAMFSPDMGVTQAELDAYAARYTDAGKTCEELTYLGSVDYGTGTIDYIYKMRIGTTPAWYVFSVNAEGLLENIQ